MREAGTQTLSQIRRGSPSNQQLIQEIARRAEQRIGRAGPVAGIRKHKYAKDLLDNYQRMYGDRGLRTEVSYLRHREVPYGTKGSTRIDVLDITTNTAYDYKFVQQRPGLTRRQIDRIRADGPRGVDGQEVNP